MTPRQRWLVRGRSVPRGRPTPPRITDVCVGRELVIGGGLSAGALEVPIGGRILAFEPRSVTGATPLDPIQGLQNAMRAGEASLAQRIIAAGEAELVVSDGPLTYFTSGPAIGLIKRQARSYLDSERARVLGLLDVGERTPIFKFGEQRLERYSWYLRSGEPPRNRRRDGRPRAPRGRVRSTVSAAPRRSPS